MADNPHLGHRKRLKARVQDCGFSSLSPHEQVELLLCYAIPQGNVNPLAHRLLDRFGSLARICQASPEELCAVDGIGAHTASLLTLIPELVRAYLKADAEPVKCYDTADKLADLLVRHDAAMTDERVLLLLLDGKMGLLSMEELSCGSISSVTVSIRTIIERAIAHKAVCVVLAHNHPGGLAIPSGDDIHTTHQVAAALELTGIPLLEHFVVAGGRAVPLLMRDNLHGRLTAFAACTPQQFYSLNAAEEKQ